MTRIKTPVGWREWVALPELGIRGIVAKIDTGARSSALHVDEQWEFTQDGEPWIGFVIHNMHEGSAGIQGLARILDRRPVTDSGGHRALRPFIATTLVLAGQHRTVEVNLCSRRTMTYPMLLGRTAIRTRYLVDANRSFMHGGNLRTRPTELS